VGQNSEQKTVPTVPTVITARKAPEKLAAQLTEQVNVLKNRLSNYSE